jgi:4-hydroxy-tetrahydrodipicolinate synthase
MSDFLLHAAITTPFGEDGSVDLEALRAHVEVLVDDGVDGIVAAGTTGEGPLLEETEVAAVVATAVRAAAGRIEVIAHVGRISTPATLRLARAAAGSGADAVIAITPFYYAHGDAALLEHYRSLLAALGETPVLAYTYPARSGNELAPGVLETLAGDGLAGLKDSTGSAERLAQYLDVARRNEGLRVFAGSEALALEALSGGAAGSITAFANTHAPLLRRLVEERSEEARAAVREAADTLPGIPAIKRAVAERLAERGATYPAAARRPL